MRPKPPPRTNIAYEERLFKNYEGRMHLERAPVLHRISPDSVQDY